MKLKNISTLERAIGVLDGLRCCLDDKVVKCVRYVIDMIDIVLIDEGGRQYDE